MHEAERAVLQTPRYEDRLLLKLSAQGQYYDGR